ncbi:MAG: polynucleotide kinase-phosphatase [Pseudomonadota bacterium]
MKVTLPDYCLVLLIGPTGSGKSTFAARHFKPSEVVSSDRCRGIVADDETDQSATKDAFDLVHFIIEKRLAARRLTVVDATNVRPEDRARLIAIGKKYHALTAGFAFLTPDSVCLERNASRPDRDFGAHVVRNHARLLKRGLKRIHREGMRFVYKLDPAQADGVEITRERLWTDKRDQNGPFDIIGDIHGCADELEVLLGKLGYDVRRNGGGYDVIPPDGRRAIFLGDLVDRGPRTPDVLRLVKAMVEAGTGFCILGNHEAKLVKALDGRKVKVAHGLQESLDQMAEETPAFRQEMRHFMAGLISHFLLDEGRLVVAHAGIREDMQGRSSGQVRGFCLYGETTGETDEFGLPVRYNWAQDYRGRAKVVYGHTPVPEAEWLNGTICLDTGCVFGGKLSALRYPELELVQVSAARVYAEPIRPLDHEASPAEERQEATLDIADVLGKRIVTTGLRRTITIYEAQAAAALETMSRFAVDPRWLIHLPPTMSPSETSQRDGTLEHPEEAFAYFAGQGQRHLVCEEKHMGSRAILVVARDDGAARARFGAGRPGSGVIYTRTGRPFFADQALELEVLARVRAALTGAGLWDRLASDWVCLDAEILPWSAKAQALIEQQYAPVAAAARIGLGAAAEALAAGQARGLALDELERENAQRQARAARYRASFKGYVWPVAGLDDLKIAPFHLLASEGAVHGDKDHLWHMARLQELCAQDAALLLATEHRQVDLEDPASQARAAKWWEEMTARGGEGMVVKPLDYVARGPKGLVQPAVKCRGRDYLRIIYGPDYDAPENLTRLRRRGLGKKRSLAAREFALGLESLARFVGHEPLGRVHECVFAVLAMESEPVDPRL